jgi:lycopene cyclase domain-containing protein
VLLGPGAASFEKQIRFVRYWPAALLAIGTVMVPFLVWDHLFTLWGVWSFSSHYTTGLSAFLLPVEEILFFVAIPFACLFLYQVLSSWDGARSFLHHRACVVARRALPPLLLLIGAGVFLFGGIYSQVVSLLAFLSSLLLIRAPWSDTFWAMYLLHLVPFLIVNGVLTALPVVEYAPFGITGVRLGTIPVEDTLYSFVLLILNVYFYEKAKTLLALTPPRPR